MGRAGACAVAVGVVLALSGAVARTQSQSLGVMDCAGLLGGQRSAGPVEAELWVAEDGPGALGDAEKERVLSGLLDGEIASAPGILRLFGRFRSAGPEVQFEVYLRDDGGGVGSLWYRGRRAEEEIVEVELTGGGLRIDRLGEVYATFECRP